MGYRSDVAYVVKFKSIEDRDAYVALCLAKNDEWITRAIEDCNYNHTHDPIITFRVEDVKWYSDFPDVKAHRFIYEQARELDMGGYRFVAIGEDGQEDYDEEDMDFDLSDYIRAVHQLETSF
jgi:hypothetical protein